MDDIFLESEVGDEQGGGEGGVDHGGLDQDEGGVLQREGERAEDDGDGADDQVHFFHLAEQDFEQDALDDAGGDEGGGGGVDSAGQPRAEEDRQRGEVEQGFHFAGDGSSDPDPGSDSGPDGPESGAGDSGCCGTRWRAAELMQYRSPVGFGPSLKTCPRWASHRAQMTSVRRMKWEKSSFSRMAWGFAGWWKEGHPVPESNLALEEKSAAPQQTQRYCPGVLQS